MSWDWSQREKQHILYSGPYNHRLPFNPANKHFVDDKGDPVEGWGEKGMNGPIRKPGITFHILSLISHFNSLIYNFLTSKI